SGTPGAQIIEQPEMAVVTVNRLAGRVAEVQFYSLARALIDPDSNPTPRIVARAEREEFNPSQDLLRRVAVSGRGVKQVIGVAAAGRDFENTILLHIEITRGAVGCPIGIAVRRVEI